MKFEARALRRRGEPRAGLRMAGGLLVLLATALPLPAAGLTRELADHFARLALQCIDREFPNKPEQALEGPSDIRAPRQFHPSFFGCYDWHSSVHGHWMLARLLRREPGLPSAAEIRDRLDTHLSDAAITEESRYLERRSARDFERPYGWAWSLRLAAELEGWQDPRAVTWRRAVRPLEDSVVLRLTDYLPKLTYPIRSGVHLNTAFALAAGIDYARTTGRKDLEKILMSRTDFYFARDRACPLSYEPSGEDFLSPCLAEADLMRRVLSPRDYANWLRRFLPTLRGNRALPLSPVNVTDPTDPRLVHLDGLNLSRAWMLRGIAEGLPESDSRRSVLLKAASAHEAAGLARVSSGDYAGEHWLASFAVYLLTGAGR